jgi:large subunit ribosomal protein L13
LTLQLFFALRLERLRKKTLTLDTEDDKIPFCAFISMSSAGCLHSSYRFGAWKMKTYFPKAGDIERKWYLVDATGVPVGRLSTVVAEILMGKTKPSWTPFLDTGDHVVVINAEKVVLTGNKPKQKFYRRVTSQPGSMKEIRADKMMQTFPERVIEQAVKCMLPKGPLGRQFYRKLKVYAGPDHTHQAQQPEILTIQTVIL